LKIVCVELASNRKSFHGEGIDRKILKTVPFSLFFFNFEGKNSKKLLGTLLALSHRFKKWR